MLFRRDRIARSPDGARAAVADGGARVRPASPSRLSDKPADLSDRPAILSDVAAPSDKASDRVSDVSDSPASLPETDAGIRPWTVRGIAPEHRNAAIAAAERAEMTIGEWLSRSIRTQIQADRRASRAPVPVPVSDMPAPTSDTLSDLDAIERMIAMAQQLAAVTQAPPPKGMTRMAYRLLREKLATLRTCPTERPAGSDRRGPAAEGNPC